MIAKYMIAKYFFLFSLLLLSACGGNSSSDNGSADSMSGNASVLEQVPDDDNTDSMSGNISVLGQVVDAINSTPLAGVRVFAEWKSLETFTGPDGRFELGPFKRTDFSDLDFTLDGYISEFYAGASLDNATNDLGTVSLVSNDNSGTGSIGGSLKNAQGDALAGVTLRFVAGINIVSGTSAATTTTNSQGLWTVSGLEAGNYTCIINIPTVDTIYETVQIIGGVDKQDADVTVPGSVSVTTRPPIDYPAARSHDDYGPGEVTWSYSVLNSGLLSYEAAVGSNSIDRNDRTGTINVRQRFAPDPPIPFEWRDSSVFILHSFAGPGVYPVVESAERVKEAAQTNQAAAYVWVVGAGPKGTIGADRFSNYLTIFDPPKPSSGSVTVSIDGNGRYRFDIGDLNLIKSRLQLPENIHPDAPDSIQLNLSNGHVP